MRKPKVRDEDMTEASLLKYFECIPDSRVERSKLHPLSSVLILTLCAVLGGAESFTAVQIFGELKEDWLKKFIELPNGIPSHDTIGRIFARLNPAALETAFRKWTSDFATLTEGEVVAIDGKTLRRSFQKAGSNAFVHMVSAWAAGNQLVLGQVKTEEKSNEITAIPRLLELLELHGCLVTIDAMGCQKDIAVKILEAKADYMLAVKGNQPALYSAVTSTFESALQDPDFVSCTNHHETHDKAHGRTELRRCWVMNVDKDCGAPFDQWSGLNAIALVQSERTTAKRTTVNSRYYIISKTGMTAEDALAASRSHWGIENKLHWVLDVGFREDDCRVRVGYAAQNFAVIRHAVINLLRAADDIFQKKLSIKSKRMAAFHDENYLLHALGLKLLTN